MARRKRNTIRTSPIYTPAARARGREVDLHGMIVDEALLKLSEEINTAVRFGETELRINHGKGTGTLRTAVREMLNGHPLVARHWAAPSNAGGDGVTVIELAR